jgi:hypothetical protein
MRKEFWVLDRLVSDVTACHAWCSTLPTCRGPAFRRFRAPSVGLLLKRSPAVLGAHPRAGIYYHRTTKRCLGLKQFGPVGIKTSFEADSWVKVVGHAPIRSITT